MKTKPILIFFGIVSVVIIFDIFSKISSNKTTRIVKGLNERIAQDTTHYQKRPIQMIKLSDSVNQINPLTSIKKSQTNIIAKGIITTFVDGYDVNVVNLWSSDQSTRTIVAKMNNGDVVKILEDKEPYYFLELVKSNVKGYCMKGFVIVNSR